MNNFGKYLSRKFSQQCMPSRDNIFLYPTNFISLANAEASHLCWSEKEANSVVKEAKLTTFGRFGLIKISKTFHRAALGRADTWVVEVQHNLLSSQCAEVLSQSLVWSLKRRDVAIGETTRYWQEFIDYANAQDELDSQCMDLLKKISVIEHPDLGHIVNDAIMIRMLKPVAPAPRW